MILSKAEKIVDMWMCMDNDDAYEVGAVEVRIMHNNGEEISDIVDGIADAIKKYQGVEGSRSRIKHHVLRMLNAEV